MRYERVCLSLSNATAEKVYASPMEIDVVGVPDIDGGEFFFSEIGVMQPISDIEIQEVNSSLFIT